VRDDHRQRIRIFRADVDEMNIESVDVRYEMRERFQFLFALAPVVIFGPVARQFLHRRELHALRLIVNGFFFWPARGRNAVAKIIERSLRYRWNCEWPNRCLIFSRVSRCPDADTEK
jgi:hypothetical protein